MSSKHVGDTGFFVALGAPSNERYQQVRAFAKHNELTFVIPERVYDELTEASSSKQFETEPIPIDIVIDEGWGCVAEPLEYTDPLISKAMEWGSALHCEC